MWCVRVSSDPAMGARTRSDGDSLCARHTCNFRSLVDVHKSGSVLSRPREIFKWYAACVTAFLRVGQDAGLKRLSGRSCRYPHPIGLRLRQLEFQNPTVSTLREYAYKDSQPSIHYIASRYLYPQLYTPYSLP